MTVAETPFSTAARTLQRPGGDSRGERAKASATGRPTTSHARAAPPDLGHLGDGNAVLVGPRPRGRVISVNFLLAFAGVRVLDGIESFGDHDNHPDPVVDPVVRRQ